MSIVEFLSQPLWQRLGLTLVHFLWQGLAVAVLVGVLVRVFRLKRGNARYAAYLLAFIAMIVCPVITFTAIDIPISPNTELVTESKSPEVVDNVSYTVLPAGDILPEAEISGPAIPTSENSIPLGERISDWLNVSMPWFLVIWMVGVIVLSVRLVMGFVGVYRWRHHLQPLPERLAQRIASLSERLRMRRFSRVLISPTVLQAMAVGYLRPMVLLPAAMVTRMQPEMLEAVIAHELAHIRRFDLWINLAQRVTETLLFYHPAVWWLSNCLRSERELCCDELAVKATGERITYASTLESVGRARFVPKQPIVATGLGQDNKPTLARVRHILGLDNKGKDSRYWLAGVIAVLLIMALIIPTGSDLIARSEDKSAVQPEAQEGWGQAVEGVQMRVRPERQSWYEGEAPKFRVDMQNKGTVEWELVLAQEAWAVELDGIWYRAGVMYTGDVPTLLLGPGDEHKDIEFYPGVRSSWNINGKPLKLTPGLHTVRLSFGPSTRDRAYWRRLRVVSNPVVIEVLPAEADKRGWGEAVAGLQCGLRADKRLWKADETPKLQAVARNVGERPWSLPRPSELLYLKAAGKIWRWKGAAFGKPVELNPGQALQETTILLSEDWDGAYGSDLRLKLSPGKHTIQLVMFVSDPVRPEAVPGTRPIPKQLRIESNVVVIEVLPTGERPGTVEVEAEALAALQAEFDELRRQRQDLDAAEAFGKRLLEKYTEREERSLVYYQLAEMYAQGGQINPSKVVEYALAGWWYLNDPIKRARLFVYWGDALQLSKGRRDAAKIYLRGLGFCLQFGLPKDKPKLPAIGASTIDGPPEVVEEYRRRNQLEMAARKHAKLIGELIEHRQALTGQVVQLYAQAPDAFDELHELAMKYVASEEAAQQLIAAAKEYRTNPSVAIPVITRIGPDPDPDADLNWGQPSEGIRVRLRGDVPKLKLDVRNDGSRILMLAPGPECWGLEVDGVWYKAAISMLGGAKGMSFGPGKRWYNLELSLDRVLGSQNDSGGLELSPGRHTIRAALSAGLSEDRAVIPIAAVSDPVEIQIAPKGQKADVKVEIREEKNPKELSKFKTTLPNGITVELVGISEYPSAGKKWWRGDGSILENAPYDGVNIDITSFAYEDKRQIELALKLKNQTGAAWGARIESVGASRYFGTGRRTKGDNYLTDILSLRTWVDANKEKDDLRFRLAVGEWKSVAVAPAGGGSTNDSITDQDVEFYEAVGDKELSRVSVEHRLGDYESNVLAIDKDGKKYKGRMINKNLTGEGVKKTYEFKMPLGKIKRFMLSVRPYELVQFKNISLRPDEKLKDLESIVVEGIRVNRAKFECGYLAWSSKQITARFADSGRPATELEGQYELWWDGKKMATKYVRDQVYKDPEGNFSVKRGPGGDSYDGGILSRRPSFSGDNWLSPQITGWRGTGSQDWLIEHNGKREGISREWSVVESNGAEVIRFTAKNMIETDRSYGGYSITDYDPSKGYGLVNEEWYDSNGKPRLKHTVKMLEVIPGGWFPVEVDYKHFAIDDGKVYSQHHHALDVERCRFNDKSALPARVFKGAIDKQLKYQEKLQKYLAMELRALSDVKEAGKGDRVKRGARDAVETFIAAAMAGDFEKARQFADPNKLPANQIADLNEIAKGQNLWIMAVLADEFDAIAVSSVIRGDHDRIGPLVFFLDRKPQDRRDNWWVHDIDMETPDGAEVELKQFLEKHPKAKNVPYVNNRAVQVTVERSLEDRGEEFRKKAREDLHQEMKKKNAREFAEAYVTALKNKDWNLAASMCRPGSKQARNAHLLGEMCDFNDTDIETVYANKKIALAITEGLRQVDGRKWQLAFTLTKQEEGWIVKDIDWLPPGKETQEIENFRRAFPDAQIMSKGKRVVQVEISKARLIGPEIIKTSDSRARLFYFSRYVDSRDLAKLVAEKIGFITDKDITRNEGKNQISIVCPTRGDAETVLEFLQEVDVEPIHVQIDIHVVEAYPDVELDWETRIAARNITHTKTTSNAKPEESLSAPDILRETAKTEPQPENSVEKLVDLLASRGYLKILMNPRIEVLDGKTAKIRSSSKLPGGNEIVDSFEITPRILDDGSIDVATKMVFQNKQMSNPRTHINIKDSGSLVIGSVTKTEKRAIVRDGVKGSEERTTEVLVILTPTIITPEMNLSKKTAMQVEVKGYADSNATDAPAKGGASETAKQDISGFVTDKNGVPIVGAVASITNKDLVLSAKPTKHGEREHFVISAGAYGVTDSSGRFKLACLRPGRTDVSIRMKGYRTEFLRDVPTGTSNLKVALREPSPYALAGKVIDAEGNPVSGVGITLSADSFTTVQTDDDGEFHFDTVLVPILGPAGRQLFARKKGFGVWGKYLDTSGAETFVKITLLPETAVSGRVTDKAGEPIADAKVGLRSCFGKDTDFSYTAQHYQIAPKVRTGADGQFILKGMPQESIVLLYVEADRYAHGHSEGIKTGTFNGYARQIKRSGAMGTLIMGVCQEAGEKIEVKLQRAATLRGVVVYEDTNQAAAGVKVRAHSENNWAKATTAKDGRFEIIGVRPESCRIVFAHKDSGEGSLSEWTAPAIEINSLDPGEVKDGLKMVLTKGGVIRGRAMDAKGNPLGGVLIAFYSTAGPRSKGTSWTDYMDTLADGSWSYRFPPGQVHAFVNTNDLGDWSKSEYTLDLKNGQVIDNIDFTLSQEVPKNSPYRKFPANKTDVQIEVEPMPEGYGPVDAESSPG